jgi:hypothetical protein
MTKDEGMIKPELANKVASTLVRHSTFALRHFPERFLDFARNDKNGDVNSRRELKRAASGRWPA